MVLPREWVLSSGSGTWLNDWIVGVHCIHNKRHPDPYATFQTLHVVSTIKGFSRIAVCGAIGLVFGLRYVWLWLWKHIFFMLPTHLVWMPGHRLRNLMISYTARPTKFILKRYSRRHEMQVRQPSMMDSQFCPYVSRRHPEGPVL